MTFLICTLAFLIAIFALAALTCSEYGPSILGLCISVGLVVWAVSANVHDNPKHVYAIKPAYLVGNSVCTSHEGRIINLNSRTGTNFMPGDFVVIDTVPGHWYNGIYFTEEETIKHWKDMKPSSNIGIIPIIPNKKPIQLEPKNGALHDT